jgi:hypothetical protein
VAEQTNQPKGIKRSDPDPRPVEGALNRVAVQGQDPNKHYVWVSSVNDPTMNPGSYLSQGYAMTQHDPDGANPVLGYNPKLKQGDHVEAFGCVLMECSLEHKSKLDAIGQEWANKIEQKIRKSDILDETEPLSANERARQRGIVTKRYGGDDRQHWGF